MAENETIEAIKVKQLAVWCTRFAEARAIAGVSLKTVAAGAGVSIAAISQFELGKQSLRLDTFVLACAALHLNPAWVLMGAGKMFLTGRPGVTKRKGRPAAKQPPAQ